MKKLLLYGMGLALSLSVSTAAFAGNTTKEGHKKTTTCKDKKGCTGKKDCKKGCCQKGHKSNM